MSSAVSFANVIDIDWDDRWQENRIALEDGPLQRQILRLRIGRTKPSPFAYRLFPMIEFVFSDGKRDIYFWSGFTTNETESKNRREATGIEHLTAHSAFVFGNCGGQSCISTIFLNYETLVGNPYLLLYFYGKAPTGESFFLESPVFGMPPLDPTIDLPLQ